MGSLSKLPVEPAALLVCHVSWIAHALWQLPVSPLSLGGTYNTNVTSREAISRVSRLALLVLSSPLILLWIIVSLSFSLLERLWVRRREKSFAARMRADGRLVPWADARSNIDQRYGTLIDEHVPGASRLWWTPDDVPALCPHTYCPEGDKPPELSQHILFDEWCRSRFTNPQSGSAKLIDLRRPDEDEFWDHLFRTGNPYGGDGSHYVRVR